MIILQALINGIVSGTLLAVPAIGFTAMFAVLRFPNFSVSGVATLGAFAGYLAYGAGLQMAGSLAIAFAVAGVAGLDYLGGKAVGDLVAAQAVAVPEALARAGRPVRVFDLERLDEASLGALMMHLMLETILAGRLLGVDPFDQPAVELAKFMTRERVAALRA